MGMDKSTGTIISSHFTHPGHPLRLVDLDADFECDGCNGPGHGRRYRCSVCSGKNIFDLHERCATCPSSFSTSLHPGHPLILSVSQGRLGPCVLCGDAIEGLHYACSSGPTKGCSFNIHPTCTELPASIPHPLHPNHLLTLMPSSTTVNCIACNRPCHDRWRYGCTSCGVDTHLECAFRQFHPQSTTTQKVAKGHPAVAPTGPSGWYPQPLQQQPSQVVYYVVPSAGNNPYTTYYTQSYNTYQPTTCYYTYYYQPAAANYTYNYQITGQQGSGTSLSSDSNGNGRSNREWIMFAIGLVARITLAATTGVTF